MLNIIMTNNYTHKIMNETLVKLGASFGISSAICISENTQPIITAVITFAVSLVSVVGGELIKLLVAYLKNKRSKYETTEKVEDKKEDENNG